jgi:hypothetical protein
MRILKSFCLVASLFTALTGAAQANGSKIAMDRADKL